MLNFCKKVKAEEYLYDKNYQELTGIKDPKGNLTQIEYSNDKVSRITDSIGEYNVITYGQGVTTITSSRGKVSQVHVSV